MSAEWTSYFGKSGHPEVRLMASGMECSAYKLGDGLVGKVWVRRKTAELTRLRDFYADLADSTLPFAAPRIHDVRTVDGIAVTIEQELSGAPLQQRLHENDSTLRLDAVNCLFIVLRALRSVDGTPRMRKLAVLDDQYALWAGRRSWSDALVALMARRVQKFGYQLRTSVHGFDALYARILENVVALRPKRLTVMHGDLCGTNILVDAACRPTAVLDFGFLSSVGDSAFDASVAAAIYNMYGPHARSLEQALMERFSEELDYPLELLLLYRAVYAIVSSNAYDASGGDGHFAWCTATLGRYQCN